MPLSIATNIPTVLIALVIAAAFAAVVVRGIIRRKKGESGCGCGCSGCPHSAVCRGGTAKPEKPGQSGKRH